MQEPRLVLYRKFWCIYWRDENEKSKRRSLRTQDRDVAEQRFADEMDRLEGPLETCGHIVSAYLKEKDSTAIDAVRLHYCWDRLEDSFAAFRPDQVTKERCREYAIIRRRAACKNGTIIKELGMLKAALNWNDKRNLADFEMPPSDPPKDRYLTRIELAVCRTLGRFSVRISP